MNAVYAFCAIGMVGWVTPTGETFPPSGDNSSAQPSVSQRSYPRPTGTRPARTTNEGDARPQRMPLPPTDPRAFLRSDLPLPPTMNETGTLPGAKSAGLGPRRDTAGLAENGGRRLPSKAFDNYRSAPATSPYLLLNGATNNGTISPYVAYVRPAEEQQRGSQESDGPTSILQNGGNPPAPTYPPVFQNYGSYYPNYGAGR